MKFIKTAVAAASLVAAMTPAMAAVVVLDFEGVGNLAAINNFYNGGTDSLGNSGINHGVAFSTATLGVVDSDAGGSGNIANEPSGQTAMFFLNASNSVLNVAAGFTTGFSFFYTSATAASVTVWDGLGATGNQLGSLNLLAQFGNNCVGDPNGSFCNWTAVGVAFGGTAMSIDFGGTANRTAFDDITFGSKDPGPPPIPEPSTYALMALGLAGIGVVARRRKQV